MPKKVMYITTNIESCVCSCFNFKQGHAVFVANSSVLETDGYYKNVIWKGIFYSCNMGTSDLPDMYAQSPRAAGIGIRQITSAHVTTIM